MKKIAALILSALLAFSFTACGSQPDTKSAGETASTVTQSDTQQTIAQNSSTVNSTAAHSAASTASASKSATVNPNAKFTSKPAPKQQLNSATNDIKKTMSEIENTLNTLDTAPDVNTDNIQ